MKNNTNVTLKDLAERLGLSIGTVQRALHDKGGVSKETQKRIIEEAKKCNYTVNLAASSLRRAPVNIYVVLPAPKGADQFFFQYIWQGVRDVEEELSMYNINIIRFETDHTKKTHMRILEELLSKDENPVGGLLTITWNDKAFTDLLHKFFEQNIPVYLTNSLKKLHDSLCYISSPQSLSGNLAADIFLGLYRNTTLKLLVLAGDSEVDRQDYITQSFINRIKKKNENSIVFEIHEFGNAERLQTTLQDYLIKFNDIDGIFSVSARQTLIMCQTISALEQDKAITTVGIDIFPELLPYFKSGTLTASIYKSPKLQAAIGIKTLVSHITKATLTDVIEEAPISVVYDSNAYLFI